MQLKHLILAAASASSALGAMSICDKYTTALLKQNTGKNQYTLLTLLVNTAVIGNFTGPGSKNPSLPGSMVDVPGILASSSPILKYFDASLKSTNVNGKPAAQSFVDGGGAAAIIADPTSPGKSGSNQATLLTHLYEYFGGLLGCSQYGKSGFNSYAGDPNMYQVHQYMALDESEFTYFVTQVGLAAASFGVSKSDIMTAATALNSTFGMRCSAPAAVLPNTPKQPQAICTENDCPEAMNPMCSAYEKVVEPQPAGGSSATPSPAPASTPASGGSTPPPMTTAAAPPPSYTGAAAVVAPGAVAALAGLMAMAL